MLGIHPLKDCWTSHLVSMFQGRLQGWITWNTSYICPKVFALVLEWRMAIVHPHINNLLMTPGSKQCKLINVAIQRAVLILCKLIRNPINIQLFINSCHNLPKLRSFLHLLSISGAAASPSLATTIKFENTASGGSLERLTGVLIFSWHLWTV